MSEKHKNPKNPPQTPTERWPIERVKERLDGLREKEWLILGAIAAGESNAEIANRLGVSEKAAEKQISKLYLTLSVPRRLDAAVVFTIHHVHHLSHPECDPKRK